MSGLQLECQDQILLSLHPVLNPWKTTNLRVLYLKLENVSVNLVTAGTSPLSFRSYNVELGYTKGLR